MESAPLIRLRSAIILPVMQAASAIKAQVVNLAVVFLMVLEASDDETFRASE